MKESVRVEVDKLVDEYVKKGDISSENSNMGWSPTGLLFSVAGEAMARDYIHRMKEEGFEELSNLHDIGGVHIHDLSLGFTTPYCCGHSLSNLLADGIQSSSVVSAPAKHFRSAINHITNYLGSASNEYAGAQAFSDIDLYLSPYAYKAFLDYLINTNGDIKQSKKLACREIKQSVQELIYHLNFSTRYGSQAPFTNITLAIDVPDDMKNSIASVGGDLLYNYYKDKDFSDSDNVYFDKETKDLVVKNSNEEVERFITEVSYGDLHDWQKIIIESILDVYEGGDHQGRGFTFPVLTVNVTEDFFNNPIKNKVYSLAAKYGTPYFQNFINGVSGGEKIHVKETRSMCCRLSINEKEIAKHVGGIFGNAEQTGSLQVVTISLPFLAKKIEEEYDGNIDKFFEVLYEWMELIKEEQLWKRSVVEDYYDKGFFPISKSNFKRGFDTFYTTVGFIGLWEAVKMLIKDEDSFLTDEGMELAQKILHGMLEKTKQFTRETKKLFNLEATPAESATYKLAKKALKIYPDIEINGDKDIPYFTNSCHIPVEYQDRMDLIFITQSKLQTIPSGGTVTHFYTGEKLEVSDVEAVVKTVCNTSIPYFSITTVYSICPICGYISGAHDVCPNDHSDKDIKSLSSKDIVKLENNHNKLAESINSKT